MGDGLMATLVDVELALRSINLPLGVFARTVSGGGTADVTNENVYCIGQYNNNPANKQAAGEKSDVLTSKSEEGGRDDEQE